MSLKKTYEARRLVEVKAKAALVDKKLREARVRRLVELRAVAHYDRVAVLLEHINEGTFNPDESKKIAGAVRKLDGLLSQFGESLPQITAMIQGVKQELQAFRGAGWWKKLLRSMSKASNPITKAAALEALLSGGMESVESLLDEQGKTLEDVPLRDSDLGKNIIQGLEQAFDPGRISSLSSLGGGGLSQLLGNKMSIGKTFAQDLSNLKPSQLRTLAKSVIALGRPPPMADTTPQAAQAAGQADPNGTQASTPTAPTAGTKEETPGQPTTSTQGTQTPNSSNTENGTAPGQDGGKTIAGNLDPKTIQSKAGVHLSNMYTALKNSNQKGALYWAAKALQSLGVSTDDAISALNPKTQKQAAPNAAPAAPATNAE